MIARFPVLAPPWLVHLVIGTCHGPHGSQSCNASTTTTPQGGPDEHDKPTRDSLLSPPPVSWSDVATASWNLDGANPSATNESSQWRRRKRFYLSVAREEGKRLEVREISNRNKHCLALVPARPWLLSVVQNDCFLPVWTRARE
jgi:hypothetical protein